MMQNDPVKHCPVYKAEGCSHVDGYLCDLPSCSIVKWWNLFRGDLVVGENRDFGVYSPVKQNDLPNKDLP